VNFADNKIEPGDFVFPRFAISYLRTHNRFCSMNYPVWQSCRIVRSDVLFVVSLYFGENGSIDHEVFVLTSQGSGWILGSQLLVFLL